MGNKQTGHPAAFRFLSGQKKTRRLLENPRNATKSTLLQGWTLMETNFILCDLFLGNTLHSDVEKLVNQMSKQFEIRN